jgi:hypothetical protein
MRRRPRAYVSVSIAAILALSVASAHAARHTPLWSLPLRLTDLPSGFQLISSKAPADASETVFHHAGLVGITDIDDIVRRAPSTSTAHGYYTGAVDSTRRSINRRICREVAVGHLGTERTGWLCQGITVSSVPFDEAYILFRRNVFAASLTVAVSAQGFELGQVTRYAQIMDGRIKAAR